MFMQLGRAPVGQQQLPRDNFAAYDEPMRPVFRAVSALITAGLLASTLSACSERIPDPQAAASALARALETADFSAVPLANAQPGQVNEQLTEAYRRMGEIPRSHTLHSVSIDEPSEPAAESDPRTATALIDTSWDIDQTDKDLNYQSSAVFEYDADAQQWKLRFDPTLLAPELQSGQYLSAQYTPAARGQILGAENQVLVTDRPVLRIGIDKSHIAASQFEDAARELAQLLEIDEQAYAQRVAASGERAWVQAIVLRDDAQREITDEQITAIPGAGFQMDRLPLAPTREFARSLLGSVGPATAEIVEKSGGTIAPDEQVGLSGLQERYNQSLSGIPGVTVNRFSAEQGPLGQLYASAPTPGQDLVLSLDPQLQQLADSLVADTASVSALVVIRPSDGAVLAAASGPENQGYPTALLGQYAPGSSFKVASALAMLRAGSTVDSDVQCPATTTVDGKSFKNYDGYPASALGDIALSQALAQSCNTVFVDAGAQLGATALQEAAASLGLGAADRSGAGAFTGQVPDDSEGTELAANMIGQGVVLASPLSMATVVASVAAGHTVSPQLVHQDPGITPSASPTASAEDTSIPLSAEEATQLQQMMRRVVTEGTLRLLRDVPGEPVIGKSGTAEYDSERNAHAWTIAAQGDLAIAAFVEDGSGGAQTAGPLVRDFLTEMPR